VTRAKNTGPGFNLEPPVVCYMSQTSVKKMDRCFKTICRKIKINY